MSTPATVGMKTILEWIAKDVLLLIACAVLPIVFVFVALARLVAHAISWTCHKLAEAHS